MSELHADEMSPVKLEELNGLYGDMKKFYYKYRPDLEQLKDQEEAARMIGNLNMLAPYNQEEHIEAIQFLYYFLTKYCWPENLQAEAEMESLLQRAKKVMPREKRQRQKMRKWLRPIDAGEQPLA
ncbi:MULTISPECIES: hypothetical protein [Planococcus]|uniref:Uncharacterized protein n=1 Tax=Planococcus wigleyi TaxID=2762216 RepID=A0ABR8WGF5_9BACL|nr:MULTISPECIES: hypothetical protein [Planococcus]MBD8015958.1 hypothetical protein [Planococcus wigleyi]MDN3438589.1 hypothetical protein [Planococcus sp. APC 3900]